MENKYIYSDQMSMFGSKEIIGFGNTNFYIKEIERDLSIKIIKENHYSKKVYNGTYIHLGVFVNSELLGVLQYGYAMNPASCGSVVEGTDMDEYLELNRMWISDKATDYPESRGISASVKYIKGKFPKIKWIQSFADERCGGFGIVYQACSFSYYGEHTSDFWELEDTMYHNTSMTVSKTSQRYINNVGGCQYLQTNKQKATKHELRQFRYIKFINSKWKKRVLLKEMPYPKYYHDSLAFPHVQTEAINIPI